MSIGRRFHFARHTPPGQIWARLRLQAKRHIVQRLPALGRLFDAAAPAAAAPLATDPPLPLFGPRGIARRDGGRAVADLLGNPYELTPPVAWHALELEAGTQLARLNLHYMEYLEDLDDAAFAALVEDWIRANPRYRRGYWRDSWNSYALSIRTVVWMQQIAARAPRLPREFRVKAAASLHGQLAFLMGNIEEDIRGNHLIKNIKALLWAGRFFAGAGAARWSARGHSLLRRELPEQILPDGFHYERSPAYHGQVFADLLEIQHLLRPGAEREMLGPHLERMAGAVADTTHGDGLCALFNDGGLHMTYRPAELLAVYARVTGEAAPSPRSRFSFPQGSYHGARIGPACLIVDCGAMAADQLMAHAQGDILSFELSWGGQRLIVDPGVFEYNPGERRAYSRATSAHNTVAIEGRDQADFFGSFRAGRRGRGRVLSAQIDPAFPFALSGTHDGYAHLPGAPRHERSFRFDGNVLEIEDKLSGGKGQGARGRLLFHPGCRVEPVSERTAHVKAPGISLEIASSGAPLMQGTAHHSPDFGVWLETSCLDFDLGPLPAANRLTIAIRPG
jgi:uncharacterized heparinase superfamily protein